MKLLHICGFIGMTLSILNAGAAPSAGAYISDPQSEYTADQATEELKQPSNILCFISNTRPDAMVNQGTYVALVDGDKCDNEGQSSSSNSTNTATKGTTSYTPMSLTVTRASSTAPQIIKGHVDLLEDEGPNTTPAEIKSTFPRNVLKEAKKMQSSLFGVMACTTQMDRALIWIHQASL